MAKQLLTIGYSGVPVIHDFVQALKEYGIQVLIDVRSNPFSAYYEDYYKDKLNCILPKNGITVAPRI